MQLPKNYPDKEHEIRSLHQFSNLPLLQFLLGLFKQMLISWFSDHDKRLILALALLPKMSAP